MRITVSSGHKISMAFNKQGGNFPSSYRPPLSLLPRYSLHTDRHGASVQCPLTR
jgi:hypothetical protein